ncbi:MAG: 50S ribosome-binding GTPase [Fusobacteriaceae bacterium]|jgi:predicted GTPase|nr:50S ribosome-binding GTPase [Fusobacteriaceae bacterium]
MSNSIISMDAVSSSKRPTILLCGETGVGKSSLVKTMLKIDVPISDWNSCTKEFKLYESNKICIFDSMRIRKRAES